MSIEDPAMTFRAITERVAKILVPAATSGRVVLDQTNPLQQHQLGFSGKPPLYHLHQPFAPDEGWVVGPNPDGGYCPVDGAESPIVANVRSWWPEVAGYSGLSMFALLPPGEYFLVRSPREPDSLLSIALGNEFVNATPNMQSLLSGTEHVVWANIIGSSVTAVPDYCQPLLGVVICHAKGTSYVKGSYAFYQHLALFFPMAMPGPFSGEQWDDLLLVVPAGEELVIDNLQITSRSTLHYVPVRRDEAYITRWRKEYLAPFITDLCGEMNVVDA